HCRHVRVLAVAERIDVDLERALEETVDEDRPVEPGERLADLLRPVADAHRPPAEDVRRPHEHGVADPLRDCDRLLPARRSAPLRAADAELAQHAAETLAVLGQVDRVEGRAENAMAGPRDRARQLERRLAAELDADPDRLLALEDADDRLLVQRLEVE